MIQKLRRRFILAAMLSLAIVLLVLLGAVNIVSFHKTVMDADMILSLLSENQGSFPIHMNPGKELFLEDGFRNQRHFSPETPYESRFFSVTLGADGGEAVTDIANIAAIDQTTAAEYAQKVAASGRQSGFLRDYRFLVSEGGNAVRVIFLDCGRSLSAFRTTLLASLGVTGAGLLCVFLLLLLISGKIVKPVADSYEKQRRFITDAGHEIKTPLTIISADTDLLELEVGENEWLEDIRRQSQRLVGLTNDLICLSRLDEARPVLQFVEFPVSDVVEETAQSFQAPALQQGKRLSIHVQQMVSLEGSEKEIRQLTGILLDNALKYAAEDSEIVLRMEKDARFIRLSVKNEVAQPMEREKLEHLFDRFYRAESSRNSDMGGYGLGLSIAKGIVTAHKGKIRAESGEGGSLTITASFPLGNQLI